MAATIYSASEDKLIASLEISPSKMFLTKVAQPQLRKAVKAFLLPRKFLSKTCFMIDTFGRFR